MYELFDKKRDALEKELQDEKRKLEEQIEYAKYEHETEMLRERKYRVLAVKVCHGIKDFVPLKRLLTEELYTLTLFTAAQTELRQREEMNQRTKSDYEARQREWEEHRRTEEERQRRQEEELSQKFRQQEEELRRRQEENRLFMQVKTSLPFVIQFLMLKSVKGN